VLRAATHPACETGNCRVRRWEPLGSVFPVSCRAPMAGPFLEGRSRTLLPGGATPLLIDLRGLWPDAVEFLESTCGGITRGNE
jgi:hypothetical protein